MVRRGASNVPLRFSLLGPGAASAWSTWRKRPFLSIAGGCFEYLAVIAQHLWGQANGHTEQELREDWQVGVWGGGI